MGLFEILLILVGVVLVSIRYSDLRKLKVGKMGSGAAYGLGTMICWGMYFFLTAILVFRIGWFDAAFLLELITLALFFVYGKVKKIKMLSIAKSGYWIILLGGLIQLIGIFAYNVGVTLNFVSIISPIAASSAMVPVIFGIFALKEKPERTQVIGIALIIVGIIALALQGY